MDEDEYPDYSDLSADARAEIARQHPNDHSALDTPAALAAYAARHSIWVRTVTERNHGNQERWTENQLAIREAAVVRIDAAYAALRAGSVHEITADRDEITPETRAAIDAVSQGASGDGQRRRNGPGSDDPRERMAAAVIRAAIRGDYDEDAIPGGLQRTSNGAVTVPLAARAATGAGDVLAPVDAASPYALVRPASVLDVLGLAPETKDYGQREHGWLKTAPAASHVAEDTSLAALTINATAWATHTMDPSRWIDVRGITLEGEARWEGSSTELIEDMVANLADAMEAEILTGDGSTAPEWEGLNHRAGSGRATPANADTYTTAVAAIAGQVDGKWARRTSELRVVMDGTMHAHLSSLLNAGSGMSVVDWIDDRCGGYAVSDHWPAVEANVGSLLVRRGSRAGAAVWTVWERLGLIMDPVTAAGVGTKLVGYTLADLYIPNAAADKREDWVKVNVKTG